MTTTEFDGVVDTDALSEKKVIETRTAKVTADEGPWIDVVTALKEVGVEINNNKHDLYRFQVKGNGHLYGSTVFTHCHDCLDENDDKVDYHKWFSLSYAMGATSLPDRVDGRKVRYVPHTEDIDGVFSNTVSEVRRNAIRTYGRVLGTHKTVYNKESDQPEDVEVAGAPSDVVDEVMAQAQSVWASEVDSVSTDGFLLTFHLKDGSETVFHPYDDTVDEEVGF